MLEALREQWRQFPPLPVLAAHYLGAVKPRREAQRIERLEEQTFIPTTALPSAEFDALLAAMRLPTPTTPSTETR